MQSLARGCTGIVGMWSRGAQPPTSRYFIYFGTGVFDVEHKYLINNYASVLSGVYGSVTIVSSS